MYGLFILLHILSATIWTGGHLVLALTILPRVLREKSPAELLRFESAYERIGLPALFLQVVTGVWLAHRLLPDVTRWFALDNPVSRLIAAKLFLLVVTVALALDSRLRLIPRLSEKTLTSLAWHIVVVTVLSVLFVIVGVLFRTGWLL
jgi:putative copper export protein